MRVHFRDTFHSLRVAKSLKRLLNEAGHPTKLSASQALVARMFGYSDWHELHKSAGSERPSPWDSEAPSEIVAERRLQYVEALVRSGVPRLTAEGIIDDIRPTDTRVRDGQPRWVLMSPTAERLGLRPWRGRTGAFPSSAGYARLHAETMAAIRDDRHWAERWSRKHAVPELLPALETLQQDADHPLWPSLTVVGLADVVPFDDSTKVDVTSPERLDLSLRSATDDAISCLAHHLCQRVPGLLGDAAFEVRNDFMTVDKPPDPIGTWSGGPWRKRGPLGIPRTFGPQWKNLTLGDVYHFSGRHDAPHPEPYGFSFKSVTSTDPDFRHLRSWEGGFDVEPSTKVGGDIHLKSSIRRDEIIVIAIRHPDGRRDPVGYVSVRTEMKLGRHPTHHIHVHHLFIVPATPRADDVTAASIAAVVQPLSEALDDEWPKALAPGQRLDVRISPDFLSQFDPYWLLDLYHQVEGRVEMDADMHEAGWHFLDIKVKRGAPGSPAQRVPKLGKVVVQPGQGEELSKMMHQLDWIMIWTAEFPVGIQVGGKDREITIVAGYPGDEFEVTPFTLQGAGKRSDESRTETLRAVLDITEGELSKFIRTLAPSRRDVVFLPVGWFTFAMFDLETWETGEWHEDDLGISLVYRDKPDAAARQSCEEMFWLKFPEQFREMMEGRPLVRAGIPRRHW